MQRQQSLDEFKRTVKNTGSRRRHKITNSYGIYDGYKYYRKNKPEGKEYILTESQYFSITRLVNDMLAEQLSKGREIKFPERMGSVEIRKFSPYIRMNEDGTKVLTNLPVDWDRTLKLWYDDDESFKSRTLVRVEEKEIFKFYYNKAASNYVNKSFYDFKINRDIKTNINKHIRQGDIDAFLLK